MFYHYFAVLHTPNKHAYVSVYASPIACLKHHTSKLNKIFCMLLVNEALASSYNNEIRYVLPVLWMFAHNWPGKGDANGGDSK